MNQFFLGSNRSIKNTQEMKMSKKCSSITLFKKSNFGPKICFDKTLLLEICEFFYKKVDFLDINVRFRKVCNKVNLRINLLVRVASSFFRTLKMTSIAFQDSVAVAAVCTVGKDDRSPTHHEIMVKEMIF